jgi:hypothetical protein
MKQSLVPWLLLPAFAAFGCGGAVALLQGRVEADVAGHHVIVTDCYRSSPPSPERLADENGLPVYRYAPCKDAVVMLRGAVLEVNGRSYGKLGIGDEILVDHGEVSIHGGPRSLSGHEQD